jgi:hypothetical protein
MLSSMEYHLSIETWDEGTYRFADIGAYKSLEEAKEEAQRHADQALEWQVLNERPEVAAPGYSYHQKLEAGIAPHRYVIWIMEPTLEQTS